MLACPAALTGLSFTRPSPTPDELERLLMSPTFRRVTSLEISSCRERLDFIDVLSRAQLPGLESLSLRFCQPEPHRLARLLAAEGLTGLTALELNSCPLSEATAAHFSDIRLPSLTRLSVRRAELRDDAVVALLSSPALDHLTHLDLTNNDLSDRSITALVASPMRHSLQHLSLGQQEIADGLVELTAADGFRQLRTLDLSLSFRLTRASIQALIDWQPPQLTRLVLQACHLSTRMLSALVCGDVVAGLLALDISGNAEKTDAFIALAESPALSGLERLRVGIPLRDTGGLEAFLASTTLASLRFIDFGYSKAPRTASFREVTGLPALESIAIWGMGRKRGPLASAIVQSPGLSSALWASWLHDAPLSALKKVARPLKLRGVSKMPRAALSAANIAGWAASEEPPEA